MAKVYKIINLSFFFLMTLTSLKAQDPIFSQFFSSPIQLNPAFVGSTYAPRVAINYRNQWPNLPNAYTTYAVSVEQYFRQLNSGIGVMVMADNAGDGLYKTTKISGTYAYQLTLDNDMYIRGGIEIGVFQARLDWDRLVFLDQIDAIEGPLYPSEESRPSSLNNNFFDVSTGLLFYSKMFYGGLTVKHLNTPDESFLAINENLEEGLPMRVSLHGGAEFPLWKRNKSRSAAFLSPSIMYIKQGEFSQVNLGAYLGLGAVYAGAWFRHTFTNADAAIFLVGVQRGVFKIGYSFDMTVSALGLDNGGAHEMSLILNFDQNKRRVDYNDCFQLFR